VSVHTGSAPHARPVSRRGTTRAAAAVMAVALGILTGCGDDDSDAESASTSTTAESSSSSAASSSPAESSAAESSPAESGEAQTLEVSSVDFSYELPDDTFAAGTYEITLTNTGNATHDLVVERDGADVGASEQIGPGETSTFEVTLEEGDYVFYCSVGNHRQMGMEIPVTVTA
jgi:plastocyanin